MGEPLIPNFLLKFVQYTLYSFDEVNELKRIQISSRILLVVGGTDIHSFTSFDKYSLNGWNDSLLLTIHCFTYIAVSWASFASSD
jgi:hypothetical protein